MALNNDRYINLKLFNKIVYMPLPDIKNIPGRVDARKGGGFPVTRISGGSGMRARQVTRQNFKYST
jgi:hypothetical protein